MSLQESSKKILLKSSDGETFQVEEAVARELQIVANMIDDECADKPIPLQNVHSSILAKIIEYCKKHVEEADSSEEEEAKKKWDAEFINSNDMTTLFEIVTASNSLNIKSLLDLSFQKMADDIKDKSVEEVRLIFNIANDFTPEEEAVYRKDNSWAFQ
ncbi:unnamed protein product [Cochlearia groenlandica]